MDELKKTNQPKLTISELRTRISQWLHIEPEDLDLIDFVQAVYRSNLLPGDPLWGLIIDGSGGGKTEHLRAFRNRPDTQFLSSLTEKTLVSGYRNPDNPDEDPSLLPKLDGRVLIIKDLSPLMSMRRETRDAIIGQLRDAYDGFTDQGYGTLGAVAYESRFSLLGASTLALEQFESVNQELGERFIKFRVRSTETRPKVQKAIGNVGREDNMRNQIREAIWGFLDGLPKNIVPTVVPERLLGPLTDLSDFTATARSHVPRDRSHNLIYVPRPEIATRLGKELAKLLLSLADIRGKSEPDDEDMRTVIRVAEDCLPPNRFAILSYLRDCASVNHVASTAELLAATRLPKSTANQTLEDLDILGIVSKTVKPGAGSVSEATYRIADEWVKKLWQVWVPGETKAA